MKPLKPQPFEQVDELCAHSALIIPGINEFEIGGILEG